MTVLRRQSLWKQVLLPLLLLVSVAMPVRAEEPAQVPPKTGASADVPQQDCSAVLAVLEEQNRKLQQELRQIKREISALNQNLEKPGVREIVTGVGFILGLFGAVALVMARRRPSVNGVR